MLHKADGAYGPSNGNKAPAPAPSTWVTISNFYVAIAGGKAWHSIPKPLATQAVAVLTAVLASMAQPSSNVERHAGTRPNQPYSYILSKNYLGATWVKSKRKTQNATTTTRGPTNTAL